MNRLLVFFIVLSATFITDLTSVQGAERFAVRSMSFYWRDISRNRTLPVKIVYPAANTEQVPPLTSDKLPVVVFSHGIGGSNQCCSYLGTAWAARGIITVHIQHPGSDENIWKGKVRILNEFKKSFARNGSGRTRAEDIRFVLDRLKQFSEEDETLGARMDLNRIGAGGIDLGALAAMLVAGQVPPDSGKSLYDERVKAVVVMSPPVRHTGQTFQDAFAKVKVPALFITGTEDDGIVGPTTAAERRIPFDAMRGNDRYLVTFQGAGHRIYGGRIFSLQARNDEKFQMLIIRASSTFLEAELKNNAEAEQVLNGFGLRSVLGGTALVEQHTDRYAAQNIPHLPFLPIDRKE
ncbi:MAG: hypothetical protein LBN39_00940 [Planctomycetaceae bacterium]|jgi:predicted dienelactone hydrolase|nr:hypothetical protein [Planctomycetaceae bacterium]